MRVMHILKELILEQDIAQRVADMAQDISRDFRGMELVIVSVLKGSFVFTADLVRCIDMPLEIVFIGASSYGAGTTSSGKLDIYHDIDISLKGKSALLVEDIIDSGLTIATLKALVYDKGARDVKICTMFNKPSRRKVQVEIEYKGFDVPDTFVVGYGLDFDNKL